MSTATPTRTVSRRLRTLGVAALVAVGIAGVGAAAPNAAPAAGVDPPAIELTLGPGQSATVAKRVTTPEFAPKPDIVFLADTTGSMDPVLANVRNNTRSIIEQIRAVQPDARFGVTEYKDQLDGDRVFRVNTPLTDDENAVQAGTNDWLFNVGGGGAPWTDFINAHWRIATDAIAFRPDSTRIIAWFGDAASRDPSLGHTLADANAALRNAGARVIAVPIVGTSGDGLDRLGQATSITNATSGRLMPNADASQVSQAILDGLRSLDVSVTPRVTSCDAALNVSFDPGTRTVRSGTDASFTETFSVRPDAAAGTYRCAVDFLVNGVSEGLVQQVTVHVPGVSIGDVTVTEGDSGTTSATFSVSLDRPATTEVRVRWAASDGTATAPGDYLPSSGEAVFPVGTTSQAVTVPIVGDLTVEPVESFPVTLSAPQGAAIADGGAVGTIVDNDSVETPRVSVGDVTVVEGDTGTTDAAFTVSLDRAANRQVTVRAATANGTATAPGDYTDTATTVTFAPGVVSQPVIVPVVGDTAAEPDESFTLNLSVPNGVEILDGQGAGVIVNDDLPPVPPRLSIGDTTVGEGDAGSVPVTFTIVLSQELTTPVSVRWATLNGTATAPGDFTAASGEELFSPGETSRQVTIRVNGDTEFEGRLEGFTIELSNPAGAEIVDGQGSAFILDDDDPLNPLPDPHLAIGDVTLVEGNAGTTTATFTLTLSQPAAQTVAVAWETANGSASAPGDFTAASGTARFSPGEISQQVSVAVAGDLAEEMDEFFSVRLENPIGAALSRDAGIGTIRNDDDEVQPVLSIGDATVTEGDSGTTQATFTVTLDQEPVEPVTVHWATADGTATAPADYLAEGADVTFTPGQTSRQVNVNVVGDLVAEPDETFTVNLSNATGAAIGDGQGVGTIVDNNDPVDPPSMSINDATVTEGDTGTTQAIFTISLSHATSGEVRAHWATANGTATEPEDYVAGSADVTFAPGQTSAQVPVSIVGDTAIEPDETFTVNLSDVVGANLVDPQGVGTIRNDDEDPVRPKLSIGDVSVTEGNSGVTQATFTISMDRAGTEPVTVRWATANGTATAPEDFTAAAAEETFAPGEVTRQVSVDVRGDTVDEPDETFTVNLSNAAGADIVDAQGVGTIVDDDGPGPRPQLSIGDATVTEGDTGTIQATFTVTRSGGGTEPVTVDFATADGTATAPGDYTATSGQLTFTQGQTSQQVVVPVVGDTLDESDETFTVNLSNATGADIVDPRGVGTIVDNDPGTPAPRLSIGDTSVTEGDTGTTQATFTISLSQAPAGEVSVRWATADGTATAPGDYTASGGVETFTAGQSSRQVSVPVVGDTAVEGDETFTVTLSEATGAEIADGQGAGTIVNDDETLPRLTIGDVTVTETDSGTTQATFTVTLDQPAAGVSVHFATANGTATAPADYLAASGDLQFPAGVTSRPVTVAVVGDLANEPTESFTVNLSNPVGAEIADGQGVGTILDDDPVDRGGVFACTARALNLGASTANPGYTPCRDDTRTAAEVGLNLGLLSVRAAGVTAVTDQTPDSLATPPAAGDNATARAELASVRVRVLGVTIEVGVLTSAATATCVAGPNGLVPRFSGTSTVTALKINGVAIPVGSGPVRIPLVVGSLELNTTTTTGTSVTQRAFALRTLLGGVVIGETRAGVSGTPCGR